MSSSIISKMNKVFWFITTFLLILVTHGCTLSGIDNTQNDKITNTDLEAASQILGESLSDQRDGIISSLNDAITTISQNGFVRTSAKTLSGTIQSGADNSGRGQETNINYTYNSDTGTHTLTFNRNINHVGFTKNVSDTLKYNFTDINGDYISAPRQQRDRVETINYRGKRGGTIETPKRNSMFSRIDTFLIDGVSNATSILHIDGVHHGHGKLEIKKSNGDQLSRTYQVNINLLNIQIDKKIAESTNSLEQGVTGTLSWEMLIEKVTNGDSQVKTIRGTVEMNGNGSALLRFQDFKKLFKIQLNNGDVSDQNEEFEGIVKSVNPENLTMLLENGRTVQLSENTIFDSEGDFTTLKQAATSIQNGQRVKAEGKGHIDGNVFMASRIKFRIEDSSEEENSNLSFEAIVKNVLPDKQQVVLQDERTILITDTTQIEYSDSLASLADVKNALDSGFRIIVDGLGIETDKEGIDLIATQIHFERKDSEETSLIDFNHSISNVAIDDSTLTLDNETTLLINKETEIDVSGDYKTLTDVNDALNAGQSVLAIGNGVKSDQENIDIIARQIRFDKNQP